MSRKPERAVHAKMRLKWKTIDYIWQVIIPLGIFATDDRLISSEVLTPADSRVLDAIVITVFNVPPTNKITIFQDS